MTTTLRLLLVEDSADDAELTRLELENAGFSLEWKRVETEPDFVAALRERPWDLIVSDHQMPDFSGLRAFELFLEAGLDIPFIFVSGALGEERAVEAMRAGARDYFLKGRLARLGVAVRRELRETENIRSRARAEEAIKREQRCLALAMEAAGAGVIEFNLPLNDDLYLAGRWASVLGFEPAEAPPAARLREWFSARIHPDDFDQARRAFLDFAANRADRLSVEMRVKHKDGHWVDVAALARATKRDGDGRAVRAVGMLTDATERKQLEAQLHQSQKMEAIGRLAGGIAHDFNNLLTVILGYADLMRLKSGSPQAEHIEQVHRAATRASQLTRQLLAFSRKQIISPRVLELNEVVTETSKMVRRLIGEDIDFKSMPGDGLWMVSADPGQVEQVIMNLVVNARDAMPNGGTLTIETRNVELDAFYCRQQPDLRPGNYVMLAITDTGIGMDAAVQARMFEPFFTTKERGKGTGLGLATVYGIVKQNRGHIAVYSEVGKGTTFKVYWPQTGENQVETIQAPAATGLPRGTETILYVEDDEQVRDLGVDVLRTLGYTVIVARDGAEALERGKNEKVDLVVTDVVMPRIGGRELAERLSGTHPPIKVLFTSGYTANAIVHQGVLEKGINFLAKPYSPTDLAQKIRAVLDTKPE